VIPRRPTHIEYRPIFSDERRHAHNGAPSSTASRLIATSHRRPHLSYLLPPEASISTYNRHSPLERMICDQPPICYSRDHASRRTPVVFLGTFVPEGRQTECGQRREMAQLSYIRRASPAALYVVTGIYAQQVHGAGGVVNSGSQSWHSPSRRRAAGSGAFAAASSLTSIVRAGRRHLHKSGIRKTRQPAHHHLILSSKYVGGTPTQKRAIPPQRINPRLGGAASSTRSHKLVAGQARAAISIPPKKVAGSYGSPAPA